MRADEATPMTTAAAASAAGYSAQQVRDLEARGVIPVVARSPSGYRRFSAAHILLMHQGFRQVVVACESRS